MCFYIRCTLALDISFFYLSYHLSVQIKWWKPNVEVCWRWNIHSNFSNVPNQEEILALPIFHAWIYINDVESDTCTINKTPYISSKNCAFNLLLVVNFRIQSRAFVSWKLELVTIAFRTHAKDGWKLEPCIGNWGYGNTVCENIHLFLMRKGLVGLCFRSNRLS